MKLFIWLIAFCFRGLCAQEESVTTTELEYTTTTTESPLCIHIDAPLLLTNTSTETSIDTRWNTTQSSEACEAEILTVLCKADEQNHSWVIPYRNITVQMNSTKLVSVLIDELSEYTSYTCSAILVVGNYSSAETQVVFQTKQGVPSEPQNLTVTDITSNSFVISWEEPYKIPGPLITYTIEVVKGDANHYVPYECQTDFRIVKVTTELILCYQDALPDYNYTVTVLASTEAGNGTSVTTHLSTEPAVPGAVEDIAHTLKETEEDFNVNISVSITWKASCNTNGPVDYFLLSLHGYYTENKLIYDERNFTVDYNTYETYSYDIYDIMPSSQYTYSIQLVSTLYNFMGNKSESTFLTATDYPSMPTMVSIRNENPTNFTVTWEEPEKRAGKIVSYYIQILETGPAYKTPYYCQNTTDINISEFVENKTYTFPNATPYYMYNVSVNAVTQRGRGPSAESPIITSYSTPGQPENIETIFTDFSSVLNYNIITKLIWTIPCNINGPLEYIEIIISGNYSEDNTIQDLRQLNFSQISFDTDVNFVEITNLNASFNYEVSLRLILNNELPGERSSHKFSTPLGYPGAPTHFSEEILSDRFTLFWAAPTEHRGKIIKYYVEIVSRYPRISYNNNCEYISSNYAFDTNDSYSLIFEEALPFYDYTVSIKAETERGNGTIVTRNFTTAYAAPEQITNFTTTTKLSNTEDYEAWFNISFDPPCYTNGPLKYYKISYQGTRTGFEEHTQSEIVNQTFYSFSLKPTYDYVVNMTVVTDGFSNSSLLNFSAPAGVPILSDYAEGSESMQIIEQTQISMTLHKKDFNAINGEIIYIAVIISSGNVTGGEYNLWAATDWPTPNTSMVDVYYQATEMYWNPFDESTELVEFVIGNDTECTAEQFCNKPLKEGTQYFVIIRVFTKNFYRNGWPVAIVTGSSSKLALILGSLFGILGLVFLGFLAFIVWKSKMFMYPSTREPNATNTDIPVNKFVLYCKKLEGNPDKLKEQYILLSEKTKEATNSHTTNIAVLPENRRKNRYINILPFDETRVRLLIDEDDDLGSDYINASYIKGYSGNIEYIATQGPLECTCRDFWKMVIQENVVMIVMVSQFIEQNKVKCHKYFPNNHETMHVGEDMEVRCATELHFGSYCVRSLQVKKDLHQYTVTHMQFLEWPDFGVPNGTENMLQFIQHIREKLKVGEGRIIIHCSAGVGRTGTIIATDILLQKVQAKTNIDVFTTVLNLRKQRINMVQTEKQYLYIHNLIRDSVEHPLGPESLEYPNEALYENMEIIKQIEVESKL